MNGAETLAHNDDGAANTALIFASSAEAETLRPLLETRGYAVRAIDNAAAANEKSTTLGSCRLAVFTDSFSGTVDQALIGKVKQRWSPEKMIALSPNEDHELEGKLRSAGLLFFGSKALFLAQADHILHGSVERNAQGKQEQAQRLESRLLAPPPLLKSKLKRYALLAGLFGAELLARSIELVVAAAVLLLAGVPVWLVLLLRKVATGTPITERVELLLPNGGNSSSSSSCLQARRFFKVGSLLRNIPLFLSLLSGRLALVGTTLRECGKAETPKPEDGYINAIKPGIISLWQIRTSSKIAHGGKTAIEWEYAFSKNLLYDLMLMLRMIPALLYEQSSSEFSPYFSILGITLRNDTMKEAIARISDALDNKKQSSIFFLNPDCMNKMVGDKEYFNTLEQADSVLADGIGLVIAGKLLGTPLKENINGTDMLPYLCGMAAERGNSLFLLGGKPGVAEEAGRKLGEQYGVAIAGTHHGYFDRQQSSDDIVRTINDSGAQILLVAFGAPLQEKWIAAHRHALTPTILMGVGGLLDFYSGNIRRAPVWLREIGFEWIYRILQEPGRMWKRYVLGNPLFLYRVLKWKLYSQRL